MPSTLLLRDRKGLHESTSAWDVACVMALCIQILISACFALNNIPQPCRSRADSVRSASKRSEARSTPDCCLNLDPIPLNIKALRYLCFSIRYHEVSYVRHGSTFSQLRLEPHNPTATYLMWSDIESYAVICRASSCGGTTASAVV